MSIRYIRYLDIVPLSLLLQEGEQVVVQFPVHLVQRTVAADVADAPVSVLNQFMGQDSILFYGKKEGFATIRVTAFDLQGTDRQQLEYYFHVVVEGEPEE